MDFCTMGMFILDDIFFRPPQLPVIGIMGGAGSYAALGARLFRPPKPSSASSLVGWVVHAGSDFPSELRQEIDSWQTGCEIIETPERQTSRGLNVYRENDHRDFEYLSPKMRIDHTMLPKKHLLAKTFHLICSPLRCIDLVKGILGAREAIRPKETSLKPPIFVWEPVPDLCVQSELSNALQALKYVDVMSPNLSELGALFGVTHDPSNVSDSYIFKEQCKELLDSGFGPKPCAVVVRLGELGCYVAQHTRHALFPAYHRRPNELQPAERETWTDRVVDPTGGGNTYLGGYCIGLLTVPRSPDLTSFEAAAIYGLVAASFAIEQAGMPKLSGGNKDKEDLWNGETVSYRLHAYEERLEHSKHNVSTDEVTT